MTNENQNKAMGYAALYRSIMRKAWYKKSEFVHLFIHLILKATHTEYETFFEGKTITLKPGQLVTGRKVLSEETGINESKVERILKYFQIEQQIEQQTSNKSRLISISNWDEYQKNEQQTKQRKRKNRTTTEQQLNTIQEGETQNNEITIPFPFPDSFRANWEEWKLYKKKNHKFKYESIGETKAIGQLFNLSNGNVEVAESILNRSIERGWKGFFPIQHTYSAKNEITSNAKTKQSLNLPDQEREGGWSRLANEKAVIS